ncbi:hypothetical protein NL676_027644 [Syzygium grande]|nr:hypothetical protein NL676_027644 [Syzygium grande]
MPSLDPVPKLVLALEELQEPKALVKGSHPPLGLCLTLVNNTALTHFLAFFIRVFTLLGFFAGIFFSFAATTFTTTFFPSVALAKVFTAFVTGFNFGFLATFLFTPAITFGFAVALGLAAVTAFLPWELSPSTKEKKNAISQPRPQARMSRAVTCPLASTSHPFGRATRVEDEGGGKGRGGLKT